MTELGKFTTDQERRITAQSHARQVAAVLAASASDLARLADDMTTAARELRDRARSVRELGIRESDQAHLREHGARLLDARSCLEVNVARTITAVTTLTDASLLPADPFTRERAASVTGYPLDMRDGEAEDDYLDRLIELGAES
jgi:hypothetical protein